MNLPICDTVSQFHSTKKYSTIFELKGNIIAKSCNIYLTLRTSYNKMQRKAKQTIREKSIFVAIERYNFKVAHITKMGNVKNRVALQTAKKKNLFNKMHKKASCSSYTNPERMIFHFDWMSFDCILYIPMLWFSFIIISLLR